MAPTRNGAGLSIGDLAHRSGVPVGTIRAWERRYGLLAPRRSPGGHRRFDEDDLRRISAVRRLVDEGVSLAVAARRVTGRDAEPAGDAGGRAHRSRGPTVPTPVAPPTAGVDPQALEAAYRATRALLHATTPEQAADVLVDLVAELGGEVVPAADAGADAMPLDLSLGVRDPVLPVAEAFSVARLQLERVLPAAVEDARRAAALARALARCEERPPRR